MSKTLIVSDLHTGEFLPGLMDAQLNCIKKIIEKEKYNCDTILFLGDIFTRRNPKALELIIFKKFLENFIGKFQIIFLRGNHDTISKNNSINCCIEVFEDTQKNVHVIKDIRKTATGLYIPHFEDEEIALNELHKSNSKIIFGHIGYCGVLPGYPSKISFEDFKVPTILGHIHRHKKDGDVTILGTPYTTQYSESGKKNYYGILDNITLELELKEINHGPRHLVLDYDQIEDEIKNINDSAYYTMLRVHLSKFGEINTYELRNDLMEKLKIHHLDIRFYSKDLKDINLNVSKDTFSVSDEMIQRYVEECDCELNKEDIMQGLEMLRYEDK